MNKRSLARRTYSCIRLLHATQCRITVDQWDPMVTRRITYALSRARDDDVYQPHRVTSPRSNGSYVIQHLALGFPRSQFLLRRLCDSLTFWRRNWRQLLRNSIRAISPKISGVLRHDRLNFSFLKDASSASCFCLNSLFWNYAFTKNESAIAFVRKLK